MCFFCYSLYISLFNDDIEIRIYRLDLEYLMTIYNYGANKASVPELKKINEFSVVDGVSNFAPKVPLK